MHSFQPLLPGFPHILHGGDWNPDQWLHRPDIIDEDFRLMDLAGCNTFSVGIFAWSQLEPREGEFTFEWLDQILDRMAEHKKNAILATPSGAKPFWLSEKYPEVRRVAEDRHRHPSGGRHNFCWTSPVYREKVRILNEKLAERYGKHPAVKMWHISNEYGGDCYCELCMAGFHEWLEAKYGDLETLNRAYWSAFWSHRYSRFDEVDPRDGTIDASGLDWRRYEADLMIDFLRAEIEPLKRIAPDIPITTNHMGAHPTNDYDKMRPEIDVVSQDAYPAYSTDHPDIVGTAAGMAFQLDYIRCLGGEARRWFTMESAVDSRGLWGGRFGLKPNGMHELEMLQNLAHGSEGTMYFQWRKGRGGGEKFHSAVVSHTGGEHTRAFGEVKKWSGRFGKLEKMLGSLNRSEVALLYDIETGWASQSSEFQRGARYWGMGQRVYLDQLHAFHRPLWERGISTDVVNFQADWSDYKLVVAPMAYMIDEAGAEKIKEFVRGGGTLLATYYLASVNETGLCHIDSAPGLGLDQLFGVWAEEFDLLRPGTVSAGSSVAENSGLSEQFEIQFINGHLHARDAEVLAVWEEGLFAERPLLTRRKEGEGSAWYLGSCVDSSGLASIVTAACKEAGVRGWLADCEALPEGVTVQTRYSAEAAYHFLMNFTPKVVSMPLGDRELSDLESGVVASDVLTLEPWGNRVLVQE
ncbi:MAG: beta-galactosidase [Candidatus Sumerlaeota bacterium]